MNIKDLFLAEFSKINNNIENNTKNLSKILPGYLEIDSEELLNLSDELKYLVHEKLKKELLIEFISKYSNRDDKITNSTINDRIKQFEALYANAPFDDDYDEFKYLITIFDDNYESSNIIDKTIDEQKQLYFNIILESLKSKNFNDEEIGIELTNLLQELEMNESIRIR